MRELIKQQNKSRQKKQIQHTHTHVHDATQCAIKHMRQIQPRQGKTQRTSATRGTESNEPTDNLRTYNRHACMNALLMCIRPTPVHVHPSTPTHHRSKPRGAPPDVSIAWVWRHPLACATTPIRRGRQESCSHVACRPTSRTSSESNILELALSFCLGVAHNPVTSRLRDLDCETKHSDGDTCHTQR